ncbi:hypothetical protein BCT30_05045 [Enterovibrio norvegicus]|uniref:hypothetical protein n=1 Tax=Enterovibrio norvegicus TaxID=188144 RepID=UPI000C8378B0|nr:hypothetical protein [Enterovibrio norvegicus]PMI33539.1 hypothetical protein BCU46_22355 [Enterovibrio norvegicus]PMN44266.1 hypothetical protein BCT30_05045 [Enterovibrio norvegicus]
MYKPRLNAPLIGFKNATTIEAEALTKDATIAIFDAPLCSATYGYTQDNELIAVEYAQLGAVSEWWIKEKEPCSNEHA